MRIGEKKIARMKSLEKKTHEKLFCKLVESKRR